MRNDILATLAYYDVLDFPLKAEEVFRYLIVPVPMLPEVNTVPAEVATPALVRQMLDTLVSEQTIGTNEGFYFLAGRELLVPYRKKKEKISLQKIRRARRIIRLLYFLPYIEAIFASGSLGLGNCDELSDLDVLIVTKHGRIWTARFLITGLLSFLGVRRKPWQKIAPDKICLNHYITDKSLQIPFANLYNAQTYVNLKPLFIKNLRIFAEFQKKNNWVEKFLYHPWQVGYDPKITIKPNWFSSFSVGIKEVLLNTWVGDWLEKILRKYQINRIVNNPLTISASGRTGGHVVFDDGQLSFHPDSPEATLMAKYQKKIAELTTP